MHNDDLIDECEQNIVQHRLIPQGGRVLIAVSGGADSTALLDLLYRLSDRWRWDIGVAHFHHGLRPESDEEAELVERWVEERYNLPFFYARLRVKELAKERGISKGMAAREARYRRLVELARRYDYSFIAVGHHRSDQVETMLWRLFKGTGPEGLAGMRWQRPLEDKTVVRPLLSISGERLREYCLARGLAFVDDPSNRDTSIPRNRVRHRLIPILKKEYNEHVENALWQLSQTLHDEQQWLRQVGRQYLDDVRRETEGGVAIAHRPFRDLPVGAQRWIIRAIWRELHETALPWQQVEQLRHLVAGEPSEKRKTALDLPGGFRARLADDDLVFERQRKREESAKPYEYTLYIPGELYIPEVPCRLYARYVENVETTRFEAYHKAGKGAVIYVHANQLPSNHLTVRNRRPGDRFWPLGMSSDVKLKDFFIKTKLSKRHRDRVPLVFAGNELVWVTGQRVAEPFRLCKKRAGALVEIGCEWL